MKQSLPEAFQPHPLKAIPRFGILDRNVPNREEMVELLQALGIPEMESMQKISWTEWFDNPSREMWKHTGKCACGRRTFLFGQCMRCIAQEHGDEEAWREKEIPETKNGASQTSDQQESGPEVEVIAVYNRRDSRIDLINPRTVLRAASSQEKDLARRKWLVEKWEPGNSFRIPDSGTEYPYRTMWWITKQGGCFPITNCQ